MPMRSKLPPSAARTYARTAASASPAERAMSQVVAVLSDSDLQAVVAFCAIGILLALNIVLRFPDFGVQAATLTMFP